MSSTRFTLVLVFCVFHNVLPQHIPYPYLNYHQQAFPNIFPNPYPQMLQYPYMQPVNYNPNYQPQNYHLSQLNNYQPQNYLPSQINNYPTSVANAIGIAKTPQAAPLPNPFVNIPADIIDVDENIILPENVIGNVEPIQTNEQQNQTVISKKLVPYITQTKESHYSSNVNYPQGIHVYESKPVQSVIRKVFTSNGKDGNNVINIHLVNGVEVTTTTETSKIDENDIADDKPQENEDKAEEENVVTETNDNDESDPKPVNSWIFG